MQVGGGGLVNCPMMPDFMFEKYDDVTPEFLNSQGIKAIVSDIDNTLAPYEQAEPDERIIGWIGSLNDAGIRIALISNNDPERVELFNKKLGLFAYPKAGKPGGKYIKLAMREMGSDSTNTAILGDQLLTDAWAGKRLGLRAIILPPINDKKTLFFRFKRLLEKPFIRRYKRLHGG